jgi:hypothetical protein
MRCPCCGAEHAEEKVEGSPFSIVVCPVMNPGSWMLVQPPPGRKQVDTMVVTTGLANMAREIQAEAVGAPVRPSFLKGPPPPPWERTLDWSKWLP